MRGHDVAGVGEGGHPDAVYEFGVPTDVVDVEMGTDDGVDLLRREAGVGDVVEKGCVQLIEGPELARLAVADAGVDDDLSPLGLD